jgi:hypothetical protein
VDDSTIKLCECGCGEPAPIIDKNHTRSGAVKGEYRRFIRGHQYKDFNNTPEKLWDRVKEDDSGCWLWTGACFDNGYGAMKVANKQWRTHRLAWELTYGPLPAGIRVLHKCDVRRCCNPEHLFLGTDADNQADMTRKGRGRIGERSGTTRLTNDDVRRIRKLRAKGYERRKLAKEYGLDESTIYNIVKRKTWSHVD